MSKGRNIGVVNQLDANKNNIDVDKLTKFMSKNDDFSGKDEDGPNYLIFDNLSEFTKEPWPANKQGMLKLRGFR